MSTVEKIGPAPRIAVEHDGKGELVIFLHGIGGNRLNWTDQIDGLCSVLSCCGLGCPRLRR